MNHNAKELVDLWNMLLLSDTIFVCSEQLKDVGITDVKVLKLCYLHPEYKIKDYLKYLNLPNSTFTNIVNRLCKKEMLERKLDNSDLRTFSLQLTSTGRAAIEEHFSKELALSDNLLNVLDDNEQVEFVKLLKKLIHSNIDNKQ